MDLERYADKRERYPLPEQMESAGNVVDPVTGHVLSVGISTGRDKINNEPAFAWCIQWKQYKNSPLTIIRLGRDYMPYLLKRSL